MAPTYIQCLTCEPPHHRRVPALRDLVVDLWSTFSHKAAVGDGTAASDSTAPMWVPATERRRVDTYQVCLKYLSNTARNLLADRNTRAGHREYGDPLLIRDRTVAGVLGQDWEIVVDGANDDLPDDPDLPEQPDDPGADAGPVARRIFTERQARWEQQANGVVDEWIAAHEAQPALQERQNALREWADRVQFKARINQGENLAVGLGDAVYVLWPRAGDWPRLETYEPGFYFPVLEDRGDEDFPTRVHLAWDLERTDQDGATKRFVRRITFELVEIAATMTTLDRAGTPVWIGPDGQETAVPTIGDREGVDANGRVWRQYPWDLDVDGNPLRDQVPDGRGGIVEVERKSYRTCLYTEAIWPWDALEDRKVDDFADSRAEFRVLDDGTVANRLDLRCDMLPLVHEPNTPTGSAHYGESSIGPIAQLFDDLGQNDTDIMTSARYSAGPVISLAGARMQQTPARDRFNGYGDENEPITVAPGRVFELGESGKMDVLDLSAGSTMLMALNERLQDRLSVNGRVPAEMIGKVDSSQAVSGFALALALAPFGQMVSVLRMAREPKHALLLKFAQRLAQAQGVLPVGPTPDARIQYGSYMPSDRDAAITTVVSALNGHAISRQTAVEMLVAAGLPIEDAGAEVDRIQHESTQDALNIANATGSEELAAEVLGLDLPEDTTATPVLDLGPPPDVTGP